MESEQRITQIRFEGSSELTPTGALQFTDDWPGLFIRGADAIPVAVAIRRLQTKLEGATDAQVVLALKELVPFADLIETDVIIKGDV